MPSLTANDLDAYIESFSCKYSAHIDIHLHNDVTSRDTDQLVEDINVEDLVCMQQQNCCKTNNLLPLDRNTSPNTIDDQEILRFSEQHTNYYSGLIRMVCDVLAVTISSTSVESIFSAAQPICNSHYNHLSFNKIKQLNILCFVYQYQLGAAREVATKDKDDVEGEVMKSFESQADFVLAAILVSLND